MIHKTKPCKGCGGPVRTSLKKPYCSHECRIKNKPSPAIQIDCDCIVCGTRIVRKEYKKSENYCCSLRCQRVWATQLNRGKSAGNGIDWMGRSARAKKEWTNKSRNERKKTSLGWIWWRRCKNEASKESVKSVNIWLARCTSASSLLSQRLDPVTKKEPKVYNDWDTAIKRELKKTVAKRIRDEQCEWTTKSAILSGCLRRRRILLNAKQST